MRSLLEHRKDISLTLSYPKILYMWSSTRFSICKHLFAECEENFCSTSFSKYGARNEKRWSRRKHVEGTKPMSTIFDELKQVNGPLVGCVAWFQIPNNLVYRSDLFETCLSFPIYLSPSHTIDHWQLNMGQVHLSINLQIPWLTCRYLIYRLITDNQLAWIFVNKQE